LALKTGEGSLSVGYDAILKRVEAVCADKNKVPVGSSVQGSLEHISKIASDERHRPIALEWDEDRLDVVDPYFLFYLRHSSALSEIKPRKS
jgi:hypothetical protein